MTPTPSVPGIIRSCIERGDGGAYIITAGFSESGPEGAALQDDIRTMSLEHDFPVFGPNCIGFTSTHRHITATFALFPERGRPTPGPVGIVSQSGGFGSFILNRAVDRGIHVGMFASTGNECDVDFASVLEYCVEDPELETIAVFAETIRQPDAFLRAVARAQELGKQIISVSPAVSEAVARAVMSHTASIVGSAEVYASVCQQYGVVQADSIESMLDYCRLLQERKPMKGRRIGVVTQSGGAGVLVASNATDEGFDLPELGPETQEYLKTLLPPDASAKNPVDTTAGTMAPDAYGKILQRLVDDDLIDGVIPIIWAGFNQQQVDQVAEVYYGQEKPMAPVVAMEPGPLTALGVPVYDDPTRAVRALGVVARANEPMAWTSPSSFEPDVARASAVADLLAPVRAKPFVLESTAKEALAAYGIGVAAERVCADEDEAVAAFEASEATSSSRSCRTTSHTSPIPVASCSTSIRPTPYVRPTGTCCTGSRASPRRGSRVCSSRRWSVPASSWRSAWSATLCSGPWWPSDWGACSSRSSADPNCCTRRSASPRRAWPLAVSPMAASATPPAVSTRHSRRRSRRGPSRWASSRSNTPTCCRST